jgi:hypothetical protein
MAAFSVTSEASAQACFLQALAFSFGGAPKVMTATAHKIAGKFYRM